MSPKITISLTLLIVVLGSCHDNGIVPPCANCPGDFRATDFQPAWSPDGRTIAYVHGDTIAARTGIYLIDTSGTNNRIIYASAGAGSPDWSPNGQWITFHEGAQIYKMKTNGDSVTQLTSDGRNFFPAWSRDGLWIAYNKSICEGPSSCGIWLMSADGGQHRFIVSYGNYPEWANSEPQVLYVRRAVAQGGQVLGDSLWLFNINTSGKSFVVFLGGQNYSNRYPKISSTGVNIAFTSQPNGGVPQIWIMNTDGTHLRQLTATQGYTCDWSPDSEWIVYTDSRAISGRLWLIRKDGSQRRQLTF